MSARLTLLATSLTSLAALAVAPPPRVAPPLPRVEEPLPGLHARCIGPAVMGGRITSISVCETRPALQYIGAASGGVWKTDDNGKSWACVFPGQPHASIGAVALAPSDPTVVYVGTGEANARNSVSWGNGVFVSRDGGRSWQHSGLAATQHIGKIVVHPRQPEVAYVAALGRVWGPNRERGLFATRDGGKSWQHVLALDADTGCVDVALDPLEPQTVYTSAYRVRRDAFSGGNPAVQFGPLAGIYRSRDGGKTWKRLTRGLPSRPLGRIGLAVFRKDPRVLLAVVQTDRTDIRRVAGQAPRSNANPDNGGVFFSNDRGDTWTKINDLCPRPFYFGKIRIDPTDFRRVWVLGIPLFHSSDAGQTFRSDGARGVHVDHHDLWINPADPEHLVLGNDGGLYYSRDRGKNWSPIKNLPISQFYGVAVDRRTPYRIYGGLQDNGSWGGPSRTDRSIIRNSDWSRVLHMDGFRCAVPADDPDTVYAEGQYGRLHRASVSGKLKPVNIQPRSPKANVPLHRFNWNAPLVLSPHDTKTLYFGGNVVFKTTDRGGTWYRLSPDLTHGRSTSPSYSHTLTALAESPLRRGLLYAGSDDGRVHVSRNDGGSWTDITPRGPALSGAGSISCLEVSPHVAGTVFLSVSRHRQDDRAPYLFRSDDFGQSWRSLVGNLPREGPVHVIRADARNPHLLLCGTEFGLYVSLDAGVSWALLNQVPTCPIHDLVIHPVERELVVGTHGRCIWVLDLAPLQALTPATLATPLHLFPPRPARRRLPQTVEVASYSFAGQNPPFGAVIHYRLGKGNVVPPRLEVLSESGEVLARLPVETTPGIHRAVWDLRREAATGRGGLVPAGDYRVRLVGAGPPLQQALRVTAE